MVEQLELFETPLLLPEGFRYQRDLISAESEEALLQEIRALEFHEFDFHGYKGKRRTVSFGWRYDFAREQLQRAEEIPGFLLGLREIAARFAGMPAENWKQVLVTEYGIGAAIGWHRDKSVFAEVIGISLLSPCPFRFRRKTGTKWERITIDAAPRSAYLLSGPSRTEWEHSIAPVDQPRYSVTFRSIPDPKYR